MTDLLRALKDMCQREGEREEGREREREREGGREGGEGKREVVGSSLPSLSLVSFRILSLRTRDRGTSRRGDAREGAGNTNEASGGGSARFAAEKIGEVGSDSNHAREVPQNLPTRAQAER